MENFIRTDQRSLLNYGQINRALTVIKTLVEFAPDHSGVRLARKRVEFERLREEAVTAYDRDDFNGTMVKPEPALMRWTLSPVSSSPP